MLLNRSNITVAVLLCCAPLGLPSDQIRDQMYGGSVAISGDTVLVGSEYVAPNHGAGIGAVYV